MTLNVVAAMASKKIKLLPGFDTLGNDFQSQLLRHCQDSRADCRIIRVPVQILDEGLVDFYGVNRKALQIAQ